MKMKIKKPNWRQIVAGMVIAAVATIGAGNHVNADHIYRSAEGEVGNRHWNGQGINVWTTNGDGTTSVAGTIGDPSTHHVFLKAFGAGSLTIQSGDKAWALEVLGGGWSISGAGETLTIDNVTNIGGGSFTVGAGTTFATGDLNVTVVGGFINNGTTTVTNASFGEDNTIAGTFSAGSLSNNAVLTVRGYVSGSYIGNTDSEFNAGTNATGFTGINLTNGSFTAGSVSTLNSFTDDANSSFTVTDGLTLNTNASMLGNITAGGLTLLGTSQVDARSAASLALTGTFTGGNGSEFDATGKATGFTAVDLSGAGSKFTAASTGTLTSLAMSGTSEYTEL